LPHLECIKALQPVPQPDTHIESREPQVRRLTSPTGSPHDPRKGRLGETATGKDKAMKYAGLLVMPAGFFLTIVALILFPASALRTAFVVSGIAVEAMGLVAAVRGHMQVGGEKR
jgi:hypothetical protein